MGSEKTTETRENHGHDQKITADQRNANLHANNEPSFRILCISPFHIWWTNTVLCTLAMRATRNEDILMIVESISCDYCMVVGFVFAAFSCRCPWIDDDVRFTHKSDMRKLAFTIRFNGRKSALVYQVAARICEFLSSKTSLPPMIVGAPAHANITLRMRLTASGTRERAWVHVHSTCNNFQFISDGSSLCLKFI